MNITNGINHLGLAVKSLDQTRDFFVNHLGWTESGRDPSYPRTAVSDGVANLTLWEIDQTLTSQDFHMRKNVGLHHLALEISDQADLYELAERLARDSGINIEFMPELMGAGPRKHFICSEPGGIRIEFTWPGPKAE